MLILMIRRPRWPTLLLLAILAPLAGASLLAQTPATTDTPRDVTFRIFARGQPIGSESVTVHDLPDGWKVTSSGSIGAPISLKTSFAEAVYDRDWRPKSLMVQGTIKGQATLVKTAFSGTSATSEIVQDEKSFSKTDTVSERTIVMPNLVFGTYEALAARLSQAQPGATFPIYVAPQAEVTMSLDSVTTERVSAPGRTFEARRHRVTFQNPSGPLAADIWTDGPRLMRLSIPSASLEVIREDIASVATRQTTYYRDNDEDVRIPGNGFSLAGTLSRPAGSTTDSSGKPVRLPAIVLVAGSGSVDRDEVVAGIPIFAQLANALADAGYAVIRYDKRGVGQSGGRAESATLQDYADDVQAVVKFLEKRKDIDKERIAVVGHSEGAAVGLLAARRTKRIGALVLVAGPGTTGADLILEQQQYFLNRSKLPEQERQEKIALQKKVQEAALTGKGWEEIPPELRKQADSPWFASLLAFDPAELMPKVKQPILIVHGELDRQVPVHHADKLAVLADARKKVSPARVVKLPGLNHLLVPAKTGDVDEYGSLEARNVDPAVAKTIVDWLGTVFAQEES